MQNVDRLSQDERGATAIEYGLIASLIAIAAIGSMNLFAGEAMEMWDYVSNSMTNSTN